MKVIPNPLPLPPPVSAMDSLRLPFSPFTPESIFWKYPLTGFPPMTLKQEHPSSPLLDYKSQLPASLPSDPRIWSREDVSTFLRWAEREFDLPAFDMDMFQMNGKAMCLLHRSDLSERAPGSGDVLYNVVQLLVREANNLQRCLPSSPITPTTRHFPMSPNTQPPTPTWNNTSLQITNTDNFHAQLAAQAAQAAQLIQNNSVTMSPAPSDNSQAGSPHQTEPNNGNATANVPQPPMFTHSTFGSGSSGTSNGSGSNPSDSDSDFEKSGANVSPPNTPNNPFIMFNPYHYSMPPRSPKEPVISPLLKREFFSENNESGTNGRLLWDFLQQLLNEPQGRYNHYIAWKNRETGVFKIVDPAGLAKLWGIQKNHLSMNYDKMSRALRYYYRVNILRKVQGERHCYQFLKSPQEMKHIKNLSMLRQQMSPNHTTATTHAPQQPSQQQQQHSPMLLKKDVSVHPAIKTEPEINVTNDDCDDQPTDLSMDVSRNVADVPRDLSSASRHVNIICSPDTPHM